MSKKTQKFYVVWKGRNIGIFSSWDDCKAQIDGYIGAQYKSFVSSEEATKALRLGASNYYEKNKNATTNTSSIVVNQRSAKIVLNSICVDAACSGNPGDMEYRCVFTQSKEQIFHQGPFKEGTNNIGEFLGLVHALAMLDKQGKHDVAIYSDSLTAIAWVRNKKTKTTLVKTKNNTQIFDLIERALSWLQTHTVKNPILKWETEIWGEIPADFGRK